MREMKKTTIPFCEYIPDKWQVLQNRYLFCNHSVKVGENYNEYQLLSLTTSGVKKKDINASGGKVPTSYYNYQTVSNGDMIFCLFDLDCSAVFSGLSSFEGMITSAYDVFKPEEKYVDKHYIEYWFQYVFSYRYYKMYSKSIRYTITSDMFKAITTPVPPIEEQRRIGEYLDSKCTQIDALISNAQQQIEKLKAYKQSVITETVTKGLDPDVTMKDSGVEWIGEIPEHWEVIRLKFLLQYIIDCPHETPNYSFDGEYYVIRTADEDYGFLRADEQMYRLDEKEYKHRIRRLSLDKDDIVYGREGERWGLACIVPESNKYCLGQRMMQFRCNEHIVPMFIMWALNSKNIYVQGCFDTLGSTSPHVNISTIINYEIPIPSYEEQNKLASFLEEKCSRIDKLIALKQQKIEKLQQYKKSLIYEYVTGKKEV
jgi:type I restriction enzyme S subunit